MKQIPAIITTVSITYILYAIITFNPGTYQIPALLGVMVIGIAIIYYITFVKKY